MELYGQDKLVTLRRTHQTQTRETVETSIIESVVGSSNNYTSEKDLPCLHCHGAGYLRVDVPFGHPQFGKPVQCVCKKASLKADKQQRIIEESGILGLKSYRDATFETFNRLVLGVGEAYLRARSFAKAPVGWLVITGNPGCGKTHLAVAIAKKRIEAEETVLLQTVPDLLDQLREAFSPKTEETFNHKFQEMRSVDLLILDDYGAENTTAWAAEKLFQILNYRYNADLPTVITSNGLQNIDERIRSRLSDGQMVAAVDMEDAGDYRPLKSR